MRKNREPKAVFRARKTFVVSGISNELANRQERRRWREERRETRRRA